MRWEFLRRITFDGVLLTIEFGTNEKKKGEIKFNYVRAFLMFKESDFFNEMRTYERKEVGISQTDSSLHVYRILKNSITSVAAGEKFLEEGANCFVVVSPDECIEVVTFSQPEISFVADTDTTGGTSDAGA